MDSSSPIFEQTPDIHQFKLFSQQSTDPATVTGGGGGSNISTKHIYFILLFIALSSVIFFAIKKSDIIIHWINEYFNYMQLSMLLSPNGELMTTYVPENFFGVKNTIMK